MFGLLNVRGGRFVYHRLGFVNHQQHLYALLLLLDVGFKVLQILNWSSVVVFTRLIVFWPAVVHNATETDMPMYLSTQAKQEKMSESVGQKYIWSWVSYTFRLKNP